MSIAEGLRDSLCQLKSCQLLHNLRNIAFKGLQYMNDLEGHLRSSDTALIDRPTSLIINGHNVYILHRFRDINTLAVFTSETLRDVI